MTRVDFYILPENTLEARWVYGCRLIEKALTTGKPVYVHTETAEQASQLSSLLWTFRADSFLPHDVGSASSSNPAPIHIGYGDQVPPAHHHEVFVNLTNHAQTPSFFSGFERVAEIICQDEEVLANGRKRFGFYNDRGYSLHKHDLRTPDKRA